jgi:hypothetical protein
VDDLPVVFVDVEHAGLADGTGIVLLAAAGGIEVRARQDKPEPATV